MSNQISENQRMASGPIEFKDKLKQLRKEKGVSQQALADAIYVSRSAVAKWENGLGLPGSESMRALQAYFDVSESAFHSVQPEILIVRKNQILRRLLVLIPICCALILVLLIGFAVSIPYVNDQCAIGVRDRLLSIPLPDEAEIVDSIAYAGKVVGNGNGMQYFGAILIRSDRPQDEIEAHYAAFRANSSECLVRTQESGELMFLDRPLSFDAELKAGENYYVIYSFGEGIAIYAELDLRGH